MANRYVVSMGDPNGIGPEIVLKFHQAKPEEKFILCGSKEVIDYWSDFYGIPYDFEMVDCGSCTVHPGEERADSGAVAYKSIEKAYSVAKEENIPLVTLPVSKKSIALTYPGFTGHTEMLALLDGKDPKDDIVMLLGGDRMKVVTLTRHIPLSDVSAALTKDTIVKQVSIVEKWYRSWKGKRPSIWIAGLNPHAGEGGEMGDEEEKTISPAIDLLKEKGIETEGPFPADTMFVMGLRGNVDLMFSCYHDQGLGPLKLVHFEDGVNVTIGLSIVRTSVDHGTAFRLAGKGAALTGSFEKAVDWAKSMSGKVV